MYLEFIHYINMAVTLSNSLGLFTDCDMEEGGGLQSACGLTTFAFFLHAGEPSLGQNQRRPSVPPLSTDPPGKIRHGKYLDHVQGMNRLAAGL